MGSRTCVGRNFFVLEQSVSNLCQHHTARGSDSACEILVSTELKKRIDEPGIQRRDPPRKACFCTRNSNLNQIRVVYELQTMHRPPPVRGFRRILRISRIRSDPWKHLERIMIFNSFPQHCGTLRFSRFTFTYFSKDQGHLTRKFRRIRHFPLKLLPATEPLVCVLSSPSSLSRAQGLFGSLTGDFFLFFFLYSTDPASKHPIIFPQAYKHTSKQPLYFTI